MVPRGTLVVAALLASLTTASSPAIAHGGGLNRCGCHIDHSNGTCHCHQPRGCGCPCEPAFCQQIIEDAKRQHEAQQPSPLAPAPPPTVVTPPPLPGPQPDSPQDEEEYAGPPGALTKELLGDLEPLAEGCGVERWMVKTMSDPAAQGLHGQRPKHATVEQLGALRLPRWSSRAPRRVAEKQVYSVDGCVTAYSLQQDSDLHVVLAGGSGETMIVEFADPVACAPQSHAPGLMREARGSFLTLLPTRPKRAFEWLQRPIPVIGPLFIDKIHNQTGVAPNGAEIHSVLRVNRRAGNCR